MLHRPVLMATGVFVILIGLVLIVDPEAYLRQIVTNYVPGMDFGARRFAPAVLGFGILLVLARDLPEGRFRTALLVITGLVFWGVAVTGWHALSTGTATPSILVAIAIEIVLGAVLLLTSRISGTSP